MAVRLVGWWGGAPLKSCCRIVHWAVASCLQTSAISLHFLGQAVFRCVLVLRFFLTFLTLMSSGCFDECLRVLLRDDALLHRLQLFVLVVLFLFLVVPLPVVVLPRSWWLGTPAIVCFFVRISCQIVPDGSQLSLALFQSYCPPDDCAQVVHHSLSHWKFQQSVGLSCR